MKNCARCREQKPNSAFYSHGRNRNGLDSYCKDCRCALQKEMLADPVRKAARAVSSAQRYARNKERYGAVTRDAAYKRKYGLSYAQFREMLQAANHRCAICTTKLIVGRKCATAANLDHDHATGKVRGVLCFLCNSAIGKLKDSPALLRRAAAYLERQ